MNVRNRVLVQSIVNLIVNQNDGDSSEDEEILEFVVRTALLRRRERRPRIQGYVETLIPLLSDVDFKSHFRMTKITFEALLNILGPKLAPARNYENRLRVGRHPIEAKKQLLIAIWTLATPDSYRSVCERFGVGTGTGLSIFRRVVRALISIRSAIIKWPTDEEALRTAEYFEQKFSFPGVIGMIDGTHIKIDAPHEDSVAYINRKGYHSIHLQVICQQHLKFIHCFAGYPGSVHDNRVFQLSGVPNICNQGRYFPNDTHLLGDAAYTNQKHLLVPYKNNGRLTERDENYNTRLSSTRMTVERSIGLLKGRFRILLDRLPNKRMDYIPSYIIACCVLHNFCLLNEDFIDIPLIAVNDIDVNENIVIDGNLRHEGTLKRDAIRNLLP